MLLHRVNRRFFHQPMAQPDFTASGVHPILLVLGSTVADRIVEAFASIDKIFILGVRPSSMLEFYKVLTFSWYLFSLKLFGNSGGNSYVSWVLIIITPRFTCGKRKLWQNIKRYQNIMTMIVCKIFVCLLTASIYKSSYILDGIYFIFL